jgi:hypothetical protein
MDSYSPTTKPGRIAGKSADRDSGHYALYKKCPSHAAVVCFDEWGPLELGSRVPAVGRPSDE